MAQMIDYNAIQMTGTPCQGKNCAAASCADAIYFGTGGKTILSADKVRAVSGVSCVPGTETPSGGLFIGDVVRVAKLYGVSINYGRDPLTYYERWTPAIAVLRLSGRHGAILLGDYEEIGDPWRAKGSTFRGDHSAFGHDYREDLPDSHYKRIRPTICWHDPLRPNAIRIPWSVVLDYWQKPGHPIRGFAGFVSILPGLDKGAVTSQPTPDRVRAAFPKVRVHSTRTTGLASTVGTLNEGDLFVGWQYANGESYRGSRRWVGDLYGRRWVHEKRLRHVGGTT